MLCCRITSDVHHDDAEGRRMYMHAHAGAGCWQECGTAASHEWSLLGGLSGLVDTVLLMTVPQQLTDFVY